MTRSSAPTALATSEASVAPSPTSGQRDSQVNLRASNIGPHDTFSPIPEPLLYYLHVHIDSARAGLWGRSDPRLGQLVQYLSKQLFPECDARPLWKMLVDHSSVTATACRVLAEVAGLSPDTTYLAGYIHEIGLVAALRYEDEVCPVADKSMLVEIWPRLEREVAAYAIRACTRWRLPSAMRYAIRDYVLFEMVTRPSRIAAAIVVADRIAQELGFPSCVDFRWGEDCMSRAWARLEPSRGSFRAVVDEVRLRIK